MRFKINAKNCIIEVICLLYILLFVYASVSKILDFENFKVQLGQSPLISAFASWISWLIPTIEIIIALALISQKFRSIALLCAFALMTMFTAYIFIILHYSSFVPCSCGGILEKMGWKEHLVFNLVFLLFSVIAILLMITENKSNSMLSKFTLRNVLLILFLTTIICCGSVYYLFRLSDNIMQFQNTFIRRFPQHPNIEKSEIELTFNSYYLAGAAHGKIYLGNYTAPLQVLELDTILKTKSIKKIRLDKIDLPFRSLRLRVISGNFFLTDGTIPCIYKGLTNNWSAKFLNFHKPTFTLAEPIDSVTVALRAERPITGENILAVVKLNTTPEIKLRTDLLDKQIDGLFDTDGTLSVDRKNKKISYLYRYHNTFLTTDFNLENPEFGKTIDTVTKAKIIIDTIHSRNERKLSSKTLVVNRLSESYNGLLFVNSNLRGQYESEGMWRKASIIDIYRMTDKSYLLSFYIYDVGNSKVKQILVYQNNLYALAGTQIVRYTLTPAITDFYEVK